MNRHEQSEEVMMKQPSQFGMKSPFKKKKSVLKDLSMQRIKT